MDHLMGGEVMESAKRGVERCNQLESLQQEEKRLEKRLVQVKRGQKILEAHPDMLELLEILGSRQF